MAASQIPPSPAWRAWLARSGERWPLLGEVAGLAETHNLVDRAAALAMYSMLAAVPTLLASFSVVGFLLGAVDVASEASGLGLEVRLVTLARLTRWMREALPGVTWNPADFVATLVRHRTQNGVIGFVLAVALGLAVFSRIDAAIRDLFGRPRRSTLRAARYMSALVVVMVLAALLLNLLGPLIEWGLQVAGHSVRALSLGWVDGVGLIVVLTQILPISLMFYLLVRWSAGRVGKRRLAFTAWLFGLLWALGQRLFTLYVKSVVDMDAVYGALTGVVALLLWLFYANLAFLFTVAVVAALDGRRRRRHFATRMQTDPQLIDGEGDADVDPSPQASSTDPTGLPSDNTACVTGVTHASP
jgi:membrane protein